MKHRILIVIAFIIILGIKIFSEQVQLNNSADYRDIICISVKLYINKIYDIDTINESFSVDGYLTMSWDVNPEIVILKETTRTFENELMDDFVNEQGMKFPLIEFINTLGAREISNKRLIIRSNTLIYNERFNAVFHNIMDFRKFPFDSQSFYIQMEPFSYDQSDLLFVDYDIEINSDNSLIGWEIKNTESRVDCIAYDHLSILTGEPQKFSRTEFIITADRRPGYYIWQVLFPLILIILSSCVVFWLKEFSDQLATSFTLMLTVVAFNFYSASFLPQLPYNTFIESFIMLGYIIIFVTIIAIVFLRVLNDKYGLNKGVISKIRFIYPLVSFISFLMVINHFF